MKLPKQSEKYNRCGVIIHEIRKKKKLSQEQLAVKMQIAGLDITQKIISRVEAQKRIVPDYELIYFAEVLGVTVYQLLEIEEVRDV